MSSLITKNEAVISKKMQMSLRYWLLSFPFSVDQSQLTWNVLNCTLFSDIWNSQRSTAKCLHHVTFTMFSFLVTFHNIVIFRDISRTLLITWDIGFRESSYRTSVVNYFYKMLHLWCLVSKYVQKFKNYKNMQELSEYLSKSTTCHKIFWNFFIL